MQTNDIIVPYYNRDISFSFFFQRGTYPYNGEP